MPSSADSAAMAAPVDQAAVVAALSVPAVYGRRAAGDRVERINTHVSHLFLVGDRAYKLKRAVRFPYLDFTTVAERRRACEAEVRVNRRTAPGLYLGVVAVTRDAAGELALDGDGEAIDWVVEMARFDQATLFDRRVQAGELDIKEAARLAEAIAAFHAAAVDHDHGGAAGIRMIVDNNAQAFRALTGGAFDRAEVDDLVAATGAAWQSAAALLDARQAAGRVRHCHGDLHLRNICLVDGRPTLFDAIEFDPAFATIDMLYDLAFLLMDLNHRGHRELTNAVMNRYLNVTDNGDGLAALPLFMAMRAAIRAHVTAAISDTAADPAAQAAAHDEARAYLAASLTYLEPVPPVAVAVGGLSGSGKSRLARFAAAWLGCAPGARIVRSDVERKRLMGVALHDRLPDEAYGHAVTARTFEAFYTAARVALDQGQAVIMDAVFALPAHRAAAEAVARDAGVPFRGLWLEAPERTRIDRVERRLSDASDADARVVRLQAGYDTGTIDWTRIDSSGPREATLAQARDALGPLCSPPNGAS